MSCSWLINSCVLLISEFRYYLHYMQWQSWKTVLLLTYLQEVNGKCVGVDSKHSDLIAEFVRLTHQHKLLFLSHAFSIKLTFFPAVVACCCYKAPTVQALISSNKSNCAILSCAILGITKTLCAHFTTAQDLAQIPSHAHTLYTIGLALWASRLVPSTEKFCLERHSLLKFTMENIEHDIILCNRECGWDLGHRHKTVDSNAEVDSVWQGVWVQQETIVTICTARSLQIELGSNIYNYYALQSDSPKGKKFPINHSTRSACPRIVSWWTDITQRYDRL